MILVIPMRKAGHVLWELYVRGLRIGAYRTRDEALRAAPRYH